MISALQYTRITKEGSHEPAQAHHAIVFYALAAALACGLLAFGLCAPKSVTLNTQTSFANINDGWQLYTQGDGQTLALESLCNYAYDAQTVTITRTLPQDTTTEYLLFYTEHQEVYVSIGDDLIYAYEIPDGFAFLQTPGSTWHTIALGEAYAGQEISITFVCPFARYQTLPSNLFYLPQGMLQLAQAYSIWFCNTVALIMIALAVIACISASAWKSRLLKSYTLRVGLVYGLIAFWLLAEINIATLVLGNDITTYLFSMLLIRLLPLSFYYFFETLSPAKTRWHTAAEWIFAANIFIPFLLQFTLHISLLDTLIFHYMLAFIAASVVLGCIAMQLRKAIVRRTAPSLFDTLYYLNALLLFGALGEIVLYVSQTSLWFLRGVSISVAAILFTITTRIILTRIEAMFERETEALAQENNKLQLMPLMQQINAHFLFNMLNNISFLCLRDPDAANKSVVLLAQYMREYMFLVGTSDLIPFSREQSLMEAYLSIQQIRFRETFTFSIVSDAPEFYLPPLCIQPFVENAILHGVRAKRGGGHITIASAQEGEFIKITVQDNGGGFDTATLQASSRVGIQNVQKRLAIYGGWAGITSTPSGTTVEIFIPQEIPRLQS